MMTALSTSRSLVSGGYGQYNPFEEHIWGLFMDEHVFPGADASCPMGWVVTHLEKAGFEVQRAQNLGWHYSQTLASWLQVWTEKKALVVRAMESVPGEGGRSS